MALRSPVAVMKFGGTSVADASAIRRVAAIVAATRPPAARAPLVVVSAMAGVTDALLALVRAAAAGEREAIHRGVDALRRRHMETLWDLIPSSRGTPLEAIVDDQVEALRAMLNAVSTLREASPRSTDGVAAAGELLSSRIVAAALQHAGLPAEWMDARRVIVTDDAHTAACPLPPAIRDAAEAALVPALTRGAVPVMAGYVGATADGATTTLGRGGSDFSASLVAAALHDLVRGDSSAGADAGPGLEIQIWTDVDGMLTADPRIVDGPRPVAQMSFGEASELAYFGAKVLHPSTILPAVDRGIPVRILNSRRPDAPGTLITAQPSAGDRPVTAIACKRAITVIEVTSTRMLMAHGFLRRLFEVFEKFATPVDVVTTSEVSVSVTVDDDRHLDRIVEALKEFAEVTVERPMAILCVVGDRLRADPRLAVQLLGSLEGFNLRMVSQAASRRNLTVVLHEADLAAAMSRLHQAWVVEPGRRLAAAGAGA